jgi:hypothetical protein
MVNWARGMLPKNSTSLRTCPSLDSTVLRRHNSPCRGGRHILAPSSPDDRSCPFAGLRCRRLLEARPARSQPQAPGHDDRQSSSPVHSPQSCAKSKPAPARTTTLVEQQRVAIYARVSTLHSQKARILSALAYARGRPILLPRFRAARMPAETRSLINSRSN